ncbi:MAG: type 3 domain protein [Candidatus Saccharibacteria bacterium]|nr:type 3 domain protein [Candidatus Saccharibacteria bacterium]
MLDRFKALSIGKKIAVGVASLFAIGIVGGAVNPSSNSSINQTSAVSNRNGINTTSHTAQPVPEIKEVTETQSIPFESTTQQDPSSPSGQTFIAVTGSNGTKTVTYKVTYENGVEKSREKVSETVTAQPVTQITKVGTYVAPSCPNGTYVNTYGNTVCSPYSAPSTPAGATARCVDGTYSFSQSRSGTCSHHGGVATWL